MYKYRNYLFVLVVQCTAVCQPLARIVWTVYGPRCESNETSLRRPATGAVVIGPKGFDRPVVVQWDGSFRLEGPQRTLVRMPRTINLRVFNPSYSQDAYAGISFVADWDAIVIPNKLGEVPELHVSEKGETLPREKVGCIPLSQTPYVEESVIADIYRRYPPVDLQEAEGGSKLFAGVPFLGKLISVLPVIGAMGGPSPNPTSETRLPVETASASRIQDEPLLESLFGYRSQRIGFAFAPVRGLEDAVFWNPAALAYFGEKLFSFRTNYSSHLATSANAVLNDRLVLAFGAAGIRQKEKRTLTGDLGQTNVEASFLNLEELVTAAVGYSVTDSTALGISIKRIHQRVEKPGLIIKTYEQSTGSAPPTLVLVSGLNNVQRHDYNAVDISCYQVLFPWLHGGIALQNIGDTPQLTSNGERGGRSLGAGLTAIVGHWQIGAEGLVQRERAVRSNLGANYMPNPRHQLSFGWGLSEHSALLGYSYRTLTLSLAHRFRSTAERYVASLGYAKTW